MPKSQEEREAWALQAYGVTLQQHEQGVASALEWTSPSMLAGSILSDAQELLAVLGAQKLRPDVMVDSYLEEVRQHINRAKSVIFDHCREER